jgi:hypothetical protein
MSPATSQGVPVRTSIDRPSTQPAPTYMPAMWTDPLAKYREHTLRYLQLQQLHPQHFMHVVVDPVTGASMDYCHSIPDPSSKDIWEHSCANEFRRLAQGIRDIKGTDTITFIHKSKIPRGRRATYPMICVRYPPAEIRTKSDTHYSRW